MKLTELFPEMPKVIISGTEYEVKFDTRATLQLEQDYPTSQELKTVISSAMTGMKVSDLINVLFAGVLHTKSFVNKDTLIDSIKPIDFSIYADAIIKAYIRSSVTEEQLEKLEVLAASSKKKGEAEITQESMPSTVSLVD